MPVGLNRATVVRGVRYSIDQSRRSYPGTGRRFEAELPISGLRKGIHTIVAVVHYKGAHPRATTIHGSFIIC